MVSAPVSRVVWPRTHRLILSHFPPVDLYDDIADPADWEDLARAQAHTNPRIWDEIGNLSLVPPHRRIGGDGASWVMAAFTHVSPDRRSRFSDGSYGIYYAGDSLETALREHTHHMGRFYARSNTAPGVASEVRELIGAIDTELTDLRGPGFDALLDPEDYTASQAFGAERRAADANGIVYPSLRHPGGECIAAFWPDAVGHVTQGDHYRYLWDGQRVTHARRITGDRSILRL